MAHNVVIHRKKYDLHFRHPGPQLSRGFDPIHAGHRQVQNHEIRFQCHRFFDCVYAINGFATNLKPQLAFYQQGRVIFRQVSLSSTMSMCLDIGKSASRSQTQ